MKILSYTASCKSDMVELTGYKGLSRRLLESKCVDIGDFILVTGKRISYEGTLMPRYESSNKNYIVIKLKNGYNIGIDINSIQGIERSAKGSKPTFTPPPLPSVDQNLAKISIISTGGTIASRVDYRTGAVHPALTATELYSTIPELASLVQIDCDVLYSIYSENITPEHWSRLTTRVEEKVKRNARGVVITHGTDTLAYTAAALSFSLAGIPIPVVIVGSQRSSDRPSSDATLNLLGATTVASQAVFSGVYVVMHSGMDDEEVAVHLGTRVRKNHSSRRDAFESINITPAAYVRSGRVQQIIPSLPPRLDIANYQTKPEFEEKVALLKFHPNFDSSLIDHLVEKSYRGLILEGTGLGHIARSCFDSIRNAIEAGVVIGMTSQCLSGGVRMTVYDTGRDLLALGTLPLGDMLPETALVKLMWVLGNSSNSEKTKAIMMENIAGEYSVRQNIERRPSR